MKPKRINNKSTFITNVNNPPVVIKNKLQKNHKNWLLIGIYSLVFGITVTTTVVLFIDNGVNYSDSNFNPHSNTNLWEQYYEKNKPDDKLIDLTRTKKYFDDDKVKEVVWEINTDKDKNSLSFNTVLNQIDKKLQEVGIESTDKSLPNGFFTNVINNPAVDFTDNNDQQITNNTFQIPEKFKDSNCYALKVNTSDEANAFGIQNKNISFVIKVKITNLLTFDISKLSLHLKPIEIYIANSNSATIFDIIPDIKPFIEDAFVKALKSQLNADIIPDNDYSITFDGNNNTSQDFNGKSVDVKFQINSTENSSKDNFSGKLAAAVNVSSKVIKLSEEIDLQNQIQNKYSDKVLDRDKWLNIEFDNSTDKNNVDTSLTELGLTTTNNKIIKVIKPQVTDYFNNKYKALNLQDADFKITSDLRLEDDLFNNALGKQCKIIVKPTEKNYKLSGQLEITITVHATNKNATTQNHNSSKDFKLDGIYLPDGKNANALQDGEHVYEQKGLFANWMDDKKDSLKSQCKNAYSVDKDSFQGDVISKYQLDSQSIETVNFNIGDIKNEKINNFYDLINKTKKIYLQTIVTNDPTAKDRVLKSVELIFISTESKPQNDNILYHFDLVKEEKNHSITNKAELMLPSFEFKISYQQNN